MGSIKRLIFENIINCRDLGGYVCRHGVTQFGRFLRCGIPDTPTSGDIVKLMKYGVKTVIDLRGDWECENQPSVFQYLDGVDYHHVGVFELNAAIINEFDGTLESSYELSIDQYKECYAKVLSIIADAKDGCVLFHCFFGKDRTGMLAALLLSIAGAEIEDIIADYQVSYTYIAPYIEREKANPDGNIWDTNDANYLSNAKTIIGLMNYIIKKYGSTDNYLAEIGIDDTTKEKIRARFFA